MELNQTRSITILVAALGGEGGGVLADWLIAAAHAHDFPVQSTSIPGVAQRTGATTYYIEIFPVARRLLNGRQPVMSLTPVPGGVDVVAASELVEAGRVIQNGHVHPERTTLIASSHREYAVVEKSAMSDGRYEGERIGSAAAQMAQTLVLQDLKAIALRHGTVINTVLFGAMAGAGALPVSRAACEQAIRESGKAVDASLKGFAAGHALAMGLANVAVDATAAGELAWHPRVAALPPALRELAQAGVMQVLDYQDRRYASFYLDRVEALCGAERDAGGGPAQYQASREAARYLALWMSYEDVIRVADLKTRAERLARVRAEVGAAGHEPVLLTEYLKPGVDELCSLLPPALAGATRRYFERRGRGFNVGLHLRTDTVTGFAMLAALRSLRGWRRHSSRYRDEQQMMERWLATLHAALPVSPRLALELALCGNLVKGYGETSERGHGNLAKILLDFEMREGDRIVPDVLAERVRNARNAALQDPDGRAMASVLGIKPPELKARPMRFVRKENLTTPS
jgi:indolepyruvate ferredoxin oxidoreductase beta subunit